MGFGLDSVSFAELAYVEGVRPAQRCFSSRSRISFAPQIVYAVSSLACETAAQRLVKAGPRPSKKLADRCFTAQLYVRKRSETYAKSQVGSRRERARKCEATLQAGIFHGAGQPEGGRVQEASAMIECNWKASVRGHLLSCLKIFIPEGITTSRAGEAGGRKFRKREECL